MILLMDDQNQRQEASNIKPPFFSKIKFFLSANKFIIIFVAVLSILSFGSTVYLLMTNKKISSANVSPQTKISLISSPTPAPLEKISSSPPTLTPALNISPINPTASWSAYTSSKYSYSIKYPFSWTAQITTQADPKILEYVVFNPAATKAGTLSITLSYGTRTYLEALALDPQVGETMLVASVSSTKKNSKDSNGYKAINVIVPFGSNTIIFNAKDAFASLFNQMLSTLKLTK
jgi:hypothetical protein